VDYGRTTEGRRPVAYLSLTESAVQLLFARLFWTALLTEHND